MIAALTSVSCPKCNDIFRLGPLSPVILQKVKVWECPSCNYAGKPLAFLANVLTEDNETRTETMPKLTTSPSPKVTDNEKLNLTEELRKLIVGQDHVLDEITSLVYRWEVGLSPQGAPAGTCLLLGPTGTGKTASVEALAQVLFGSEKSFIKIDCAEFSHSHEIAKLLGCFVPGTRVLMADGSTKAIETIQIGDNVISKTGVPRKVLNLYEYQQDGEMLKFDISSNNVPLLTTKDHKIWAIRNPYETGKRVRNPKEIYTKDKLEYISAKDLKRNDIVVYPRRKFDVLPNDSVIDLGEFAKDGRLVFLTPTEIYTQVGKPRFKGLTIPREVKLDKSFMRLAGYYVSEGGVSKDLGQFHFTMGIPHDNLALDEIENLISKVFGQAIKPNRKLHGRGTAERIRACSVPVSTMFAELFGDHVNRKKVPEWFMSLSTDLLWEFVDAAFQGDGGKSVLRRLDYSTTSQTLATQMEMILRRLGFTTSMQTTHDVKHPNWSVRYRIYVSGEQIDKFVSHLPMVGPKIKLSNPGNSGIQRMSFVDEDYIYFKIENIEKFKYFGPVYDISVDVDASYVVNSITVSNSPPGYLGHRETSPALTQENLNRHWNDKYKCSILLLDEIEKASDALWNLLLGIMDKATLTLGDNRKVDFSNTFVFMTSNLGAREMASELAGAYGYGGNNPQDVSQSKLDDIALSAAKKRFNPEFLNRIDLKLVYRTLTKDNLNEILEQILTKLQLRLFAAKGPTLHLQIGADVKEYLLTEGFSKAYGARELKRAVERLLSIPLVRVIRDEQLKSYDVRVVMKEGKIGFK